MIRPEQSRAARGLLKWSQRDLADRAGVGLSTVREFESGERQTHAGNLEAVERAITAAGVELIPENGGGVGVRLKVPVGSV